MDLIIGLKVWAAGGGQRIRPTASSECHQSDYS